MRFYKETTNEYLGEDITIDELQQSTTQTNIFCYGYYIVDVEKEEEEYVIEEYPNGGKDIGYRTIIEEQGHWDSFDEFGNELELDIPETADHSIRFTTTQRVTYVHDLTDEEKTEQEEQRREMAEQMSKSKVFSNADSVSDKALCDIYVSIGSSDKETFAKIYARRVTREEITIDDVPSELKEIVEKILASGYICYNSLPTQIEKNKSFLYTKLDTPQIGDVLSGTIIINDTEEQFEETVKTLYVGGQEAQGIELFTDGSTKRVIFFFHETMGEDKIVILNEKYFNTFDCGKLTIYMERR